MFGETEEELRRTKRIFKKNKNKKTLKKFQPTLEDWFEIILEIFRIEKLTNHVILQKNKISYSLFTFKADSSDFFFKYQF